MSFASIFSFLGATIIPEDINGFFGIMWGSIGNFFVDMFAHVANWFYGICKWFLAFVDFLQYFIQKLIGLDYWLSSGQKSIQGATESDLLFSFLYNETVQKVFRALVGVFIVLLIVFTIFAIIRQEWRFVTGTEDKNTKTKIISNSLRAIALVVIVPLILVLGVISSNAILASIVKALNIDGSTSFGNSIFSAGAVSANRYRNYADSHDRVAMSTDVTFYVKKSDPHKGRVVEYSPTDEADDGYVYTENDYMEYLKIINDSSKVNKYTVDSVFEMFDPDDDIGRNFKGYCVEIKINGENKYYMVQARTTNEKEGMYYYLNNILKANIITPGEAAIADEVDSETWGDVKTGYIDGLNIDGYGSSSKLVEACYNTREYATIYRSVHDFESTISSFSVSSYIEDNFKLTGHSSLKVMYNSGTFENYFDGGQTSMVSLNAEYGVMADVIDFMCDTGANLYVIDATSSLIEWNYNEYSVDTKWVSNSATSGKGELVKIKGNGGNVTAEYLPFVVEYSETASDYEQGRVLYMAKAGEANELEGSKYIMCFKVEDGGALRYVPVVNRKSFVDPSTGQSYFFSSDYLSSSYKGVIVAKGNFDAHTSANDPAAGAPTYFKAYGNTDTDLDLETDPYYYNISEDKIFKQIINKDTEAAVASVTYLVDVLFDNSEFANTIISSGTEEDTKHIYNIINNLNEPVELSNSIIDNISIKVKVKAPSSETREVLANYTGVNNSKYYLFATDDDAWTLVLEKLTETDFTIRGVKDDGTIILDNVVSLTAGASEGDENKISLTRFFYTATLAYLNSETDDAVVSDEDPSKINAITVPLNPSEFTFSKTAGDGKHLFTTEKMNVQIGELFNQYMALNFYFDLDALYNISDDGKVVMAEPTGDTYDLQMFKVDLYNFLTAYVDDADDTKDGLYQYHPKAGEEQKIQPAGKAIKTLQFGVFKEEFDWNSSSTEYLVYNGSSYVAKLIKGISTNFSFDDITQKTIAIEMDGIKYYNVKTQNVYSSQDLMKEGYGVVYKSMYVGCYRDRIDSTPKLDMNWGGIFTGSGRFGSFSFGVPFISKSCLMDDDQNIGIFSLSEGIQFDYFFEQNSSLMQFYNPLKVTYWLILIAAGLIIKTLGNALWGVIKRFYEITLYYLALPVAASTMPLDKEGSSRYQKVQDALIQHVLSTYGIILGINVFFILLEPVKSMSNIFTQAEMDSSSSYFLRHFPFGAWVLNKYVYILFMLVAFTMIDALINVISSFVGGKNLAEEGKKTKEQAAKAIQDSTDIVSGKKAMDFAKKGIETVAKTPLAAPIKMAAAGVGKLVGGGLRKFGEGFRGIQSQEQDDADAEAGSDKNKNSSSSRIEDGEDTSTYETTSGGGDGTTVAENARNEGEFDEEDGDLKENEMPKEAPKSVEESAEEEYNDEHRKEVLEKTTDAERKTETANQVKKMVSEDADSKTSKKITASVLENQKNDSHIETDENGLTKNDVVAIVRQLLGDAVKDMSDENIAKNYGVNVDRDMFGNIDGVSVQNKTDGTEEDFGKEGANVLRQKVVENASEDQLSNLEGLGLNENEQTIVNANVDNAIVESSSPFKFGEAQEKEVITEDGKVKTIKDNSTILEGANEDALRLYEHLKDDNDVENEAILNKILADENLKKEFLSNEVTGLGENASKEDMLATIEGFKTSEMPNIVKDVKDTIDKNDIAEAISNRVSEGNVNVSSWDLLSETEKQRKINDYKERQFASGDYEITEEEKQIAQEKDINELDGLKTSNEAEYNDRMFESFVKSDKIDAETKNMLLEEIMLNGITDRKSDEYKAAMAEMGVSAGVKIDAEIASEKAIQEANYEFIHGAETLLNADKSSENYANDLWKFVTENKEALGLRDTSDEELSVMFSPDNIANFDEILKNGINDAESNIRVSEVALNNLENDKKEKEEAGILDAGVDITALEKQGYDERDVLLAYQRLKGAGMRVDQENIEKILKDPTKSIMSDADIIRNNAELKNKTVNLVNDDNAETALVTEEERDAIKKEASKGLFAANNDGSAYKIVHEEAERRKKVDEDYEAQGALIGAAEMNKLQGAGNEQFDKLYNELLTQIKDMLAAEGKNDKEIEDLTKDGLSDELIAKLVNSDENLGFDPELLVDLKKQTIAINNEKGEGYTKITNERDLSGAQRADFELKKSMLESQIKSDGDYSDTLETLFKNTNFAGKEEIEARIQEVYNDMLSNKKVYNKAFEDYLKQNKIDKNDKTAVSAARPKFEEALRQQAFGMVLNEKTDADLNRDINIYMAKHNYEVSHEEAAEAVKAEYAKTDKVRDLLINAGATDVNNALSNDVKIDKQITAIENDEVLSQKMKDLGIEKGEDGKYGADARAQIEKYLSDPDKFTQEVLDSDLKKQVEELLRSMGIKAGDKGYEKLFNQYMQLAKNPEDEKAKEAVAQASKENTDQLLNDSKLKMYVDVNYQADDGTFDYAKIAQDADKIAMQYMKEATAGTDGGDKEMYDKFNAWKAQMEAEGTKFKNDDAALRAFITDNEDAQAKFNEIQARLDGNFVENQVNAISQNYKNREATAGDDAAKVEDRLNDRVNDMFDVKNMSSEDRKNFFTSQKADSDIVGAGQFIKNGWIGIKDAVAQHFDNVNADKKYNEWAKKNGGKVVEGRSKTIGDRVKTPFARINKNGFVESVVYKFAKKLPKQSEKYDEWNKNINKQINALKKGTGVYAGLSKEQKQEELKKLQAKLIHTEKPEDFASWSNEKQTAYVVAQDKLKDEAFNTKFSKVYKEQRRVSKVENKGAVKGFIQQLGYSSSDIPVLGRLVVSKASEEMKAKYKQDLAVAEANIDRFNATAPMRNRKQDFGAAGFEKFANSYFDKNTVSKLTKKVDKAIAQKGVDANSEEAIKLREEAFAAEINRQYRRASAKVARSNKVDPDEYLKEKGVDRGSVRFKDGTKKYLQVKSHVPIIGRFITRWRKDDIDAYESEYKRTGGKVDPEIKAQYESSYYGKRSKESSIRTQNESKRLKKMYEDVIEFNKTFKGTAKEYADQFKAKFGAEYYEKYNSMYRNMLRKNLENSNSVTLQQRELIKQIERDMNQNAKRQKYASAHIPASQMANMKYSADTFTNAKTKAQVDAERVLAKNYNELLKKFAEGKGNDYLKDGKFNLENINPVILEQFYKKIKEKTFAKLDTKQQEEKFRQFLEMQLDKYNRRVRNNTFSSSQKENLTRLNGTYVNRNEVNRTKISPTIRQSLDASQMERYKYLVKNENDANQKINIERLNLKKLEEALANVKGAGSTKRREELLAAIRNSKTLINRLSKVYEESKSRRKDFEKLYATQQIKQVVRENAGKPTTSKGTVEKYKFHYSKDGKTGVVQPGTVEARQVEKIVRNFFGSYRHKLDEMVKTLVGSESVKLKQFVNDKYRSLSSDFAQNYRSLTATQKRIKEEMKTLVGKTDTKSIKYKKQLETKNAELDTIINNLIQEFNKMGIQIKRF